MCWHTSQHQIFSRSSFHLSRKKCSLRDVGFFGFFNRSWERALFSRTVFAGHRCLQVHRHRQRCQCQCPVTNAQCPLLLYPAAYFLSLILQGSPTLLNTWPCWRACFQQTIQTHTFFPLLSTFPHPMHIAHSNASQLPGWPVTFREIIGTCSISPKSDGLFSQLLYCDYIYPFLSLSNSFLLQIFFVKDKPH